MSIHDKQYYTRRFAALEAERASFISHWKEISNVLQPRSGRFVSSNRNKGTKRHRKIVNSHALHALRTAKAGLFAGIMSPTRPWFKIEPQNVELMSATGVPEWFFAIESMIRNVFSESNLYIMAPSYFENLLLFSTAAMAHVDDPDTIARFFTYPTGSYVIAQDFDYRINTFARKYEMTTEQMIEQFGEVNVSSAVRSAFHARNFDEWWPVCHFIAPNVKDVSDSTNSRGKPYHSVHFEASRDTGNQFLSEKGFNDFPVYVSRWERTGEDIYGTLCPGMEALGDVQALYVMERRKAEAIDIQNRPPLHGPASLKNMPIANIPNGVTLYDGAEESVLKPIYQVRPNITDLRIDLQAMEERIGKTFFVDLFMAISAMRGIQPKNQLELMQRHEERLLQLGPVLESVQDDLLKPLVTRTFNQLLRRGLLPPPPPALSGQSAKIRFISPLILAQRSLDLDNIQQMALFIGQVAQLDPSGLDKFDSDEAIDQYARLVGALPSVIRSNEEAGILRQQRAQAQQAQLQAQQQQQVSEGTNKDAQTLKLMAEAAAAGA